MSATVLTSASAATKRSILGERQPGRAGGEPIDLNIAHPKEDSTKPVAVLIEGRPLIRDCLARCIRRAYDVDLRTVDTVEDGLAIIHEGNVEVAVLIVDGRADGPGNLELIGRLVNGAAGTSTMVVADGDDLGCIVRVMKAGVRGYISSNMTLDVAIEAIRLVRAGGQFLPADSVLKGDAPPAEMTGCAQTDALHRIFTTRQAAVVDALRKGMANKLIAYELNMQESTVKVHVRNIMKKLKARNRTEVAYLANRLFE